MVLLIKYKYVIMFCLMFAEWPIISFVSAFMAAQGFFSFGVVYVLSLFGDLVGDVLRYRVGRFARKFGAQEFLERQKKWEIVDLDSLKRRSRISFRVAKKIHNAQHKPIFHYLNETITKRFFWALFLVKITPPLSVPGQISFGFFKIPFHKFFIQTIFLIVIFESVFLNLGYFSSMSINTFKNNLDIFGWIISVVVIWGIALWASFSLIKKMKSLSKVRE